MLNVPHSSLENCPATVEQFLQRMMREHATLSERLKMVAHYVEANSGQLGLENVGTVAERCGVQPSTVVRFAQHFGFSGFSELRLLFRKRLSQQVASCADIDQPPDRLGAGNAATRLEDHVAAHVSKGIEAMARLRQTLDRSVFRSFVNILANAETIWIAGWGRSFPLAVHLEQMLQLTEKRVGMLNSLGGTPATKLRSVRRGDVLIAILLSPYDNGSVDLIHQVAHRGADALVITDSGLHPVVRHAQASIVVQQQSAPRDFPGIVASMALVESLFVALADQLGLSKSLREGPLNSVTQSRPSDSIDRRRATNSAN